MDAWDTRVPRCMVAGLQWIAMDEPPVDRSPPAAVQTNLRPPVHRWLSAGLPLGLTVAIVAALGDRVAFYVMHESAFHHPPLLDAGALAWTTASMSLLAVWLGLGAARVYLRLLVVGAATALLTFMADEGDFRGWQFAEVSLVVVAAAIPFGLLYICGFGLVNVRAGCNAGGADGRLLRGQISLRQLFGWTIAAAMVASVARLERNEPLDWLQLAITSVVFATAAIGAGSATLMPVRKNTLKLCLAILGGCTLGLAALLSLLMGFSGGPESFLLGLALIEHVALLSGVLLLFRRLGFRLQRRGAV